jgi:hypothetical protein
MRRWTTILLLLLAGGLVHLAAAPAPPTPPEPVTVAGARLGPVPEVLYAHLPALPRGQGAVVEALEARSPLAQAGLRRNDILLTCDGVRIRDPKHFSDMLSESKPGQPHRLGLLRTGRRTNMIYVQQAPDPAAVPKSVLKPGGPPAVAVEAQPLQGGKLKVSFEYYLPTGKLERVTCSGSLSQIESEVRQLGEKNRMPARVQDLVDVALRRIRALNNTERP